MTKRQRDAIAEAVRQRKTILVGRVLNSGKTSCINVLLAESARFEPSYRQSRLGRRSCSTRLRWHPSTPRACDGALGRRADCGRRSTVQPDTPDR